MRTELYEFVLFLELIKFVPALAVSFSVMLNSAACFNYKHFILADFFIR